ncbi:hypothetical protein EB118_18010 [bacterium]|nr:hypothetical protein [bacterium]NBX98572.1 hypothetical protein [bacterium]NDC95553.1 hypothetical protein [bacterium]NDD85277.1 hypothetical protein [bacterium]NDG31954.1 hypothetical protein [bacterium]
MNRNKRSDGMYHIPRSTLEPDNRALAIRKTFASTAPDFFVPSFALRRQVLKTPETIDFVRQLHERMPKNWRVLSPGSLALTLVEQKKLVKEFRKQEECPDPERVEKVAKSIASQLKHSLFRVPRRLEVPTGLVYAFGEKHNKNKLGVIPAGWKGFSAPYAETDNQKNVLPMPIIVRETNLAIGAIATEFAQNGELAQALRATAVGRTPHITFAQKIKGGPISQAEEHAFAGLVDDILPESLTVFDPIIYLRLTKDQPDPHVLHARAPRWQNITLM